MPLVVLEGEPFKEILAHPSLGASQPAEVRQVVAHLLDEFHLLTQEVVLQEVSEMRVCVDRIQGIQVQKGLVQVLFHDHGGFHGVQVLPYSSRDSFSTSWKGGGLPH